MPFMDEGMGKLQDKIAVVTGAGRGIGKAIAETFAAEGAKVAIISRTLANAQSAADAINATYPDAAKAYALDVADGAACAEVGKQILADYDHVDILVNNAGVTKDGLLLRMSEEDWDVVLDTNLKGAFNMVKAFQRSILKQKGARIINISSVIGLIGNAGQANYAASKAGLIGYTKSLAKEVAGRGVRVNAIAPGYIATEMTDAISEEARAVWLEQIPMKRAGSVADVANVACFLASDLSEYITAQVIGVDGGMGA